MTANGVARRFGEKELAGFRDLLLERRRLLLSDLQTLEETEAGNVPEVLEHTSQMADFSAAREASDFSLGRRQSETTEIQEIDDALERIDDGSFGHCEECDGRIARDRLEAIPYARLCLKCKTAEEG